MSASRRSIHVVAGVITDTRGRYLLNRREGNRDLVGLWEFPGGKREPGEDSIAALQRELREELGIDAQVGEVIIQVPQHYPDKDLVLEVRRISGFNGRARGHEGQAITWVAADKLSRYSMPPADLPVVAALGGTISSEHGVGVAKTRWLHLVRSDGDLAAQRAVKFALDPLGILNPGVLEPTADRNGYTT